MATAKQLPVKAPRFCTYNWMGSAGIVVNTNPTGDNWYLSRAMQFELNRSFLHGHTTPNFSMSEADIWSMPFIQKVTLPSAMADQCEKQLIRGFIDQNYYVVVEKIDDYFVEGKTFYHQRHFIHDAFITGYDDEKNTYTLAGYDSRWIYTTFETPQRGVVRGIRSAIAQESPSRIIGVRCAQEPIALDLHEMRRRIADHLHYNLYETTEKIYGLLVYDYLSTYLDFLRNDSIPHARMDWRMFRLVYEQKKCMLDRLLAVEKTFYPPDTLSSAYLPSVEAANAAQFLYAKYCMKRDDSLLTAIQKKLLQIRSNDMVILPRFLRVLEQHEGEV